MIEIFYNSNRQIVTSESTSILKDLKYEDVLWIDLFDPSGEEKRSVEDFLNTTLQSRAQAEEIESSSRYSETENSIFINTNFLIPGPENYSMESVSFILCESIIVSLRQVSLRSFTDIKRRIFNFDIIPSGDLSLFRTLDIILCLSTIFSRTNMVFS